MNKIKESILAMVASDSFDIRTRNAGVFCFPAAYRYKAHEHCEIEINYINRGSCIMGVEGTYVPLKRGDCIIIYAGVKHLFIVEDKENCRITQLEFEVSHLPEKAGEMCFFRMDAPYIRLRGCEDVCEYMTSLCRIRRYEKDSENREILVQLGYFQLFIELSEKIGCADSRHRKKGKTEKIDQIIQYINENWRNDICMEEIAEKFGISSRYLRKCFQLETGMSCQQYICTLRLGKAKELLWFTSKSVTDIAMDTGFGSSQYFCRVFQKHEHMAPMEYRNLWKKQEPKGLSRTEI